MDTTLLIFIGIACGAGLAILLIIVAVSLLGQRDEALTTRLQILADEPVGFRETGVGQGRPRPEIAEKLNSAISKRGFARGVARSLEQANLPLTVAEWLLIRTAVPLLFALGAVVIWRELLLVPIALFVGFVLPPLWLRSLSNRRSSMFADQLAETLALLVSALRGGFSLSQALAMVAREAPQPTRAELERVVQEMQIGLSLNDSLDNLCTRLTVEDLELVVTAIKVNARVGGNLTEILESISTTIRERFKLRREVQVITSMQRASAYIIGLLPPALAVIIFTINPEYMLRLFTPGWTLCIPIMAVLFALVGFITIRKIADIKV
jgi:tight adherence protein B